MVVMKIPTEWHEFGVLLGISVDHLREVEIKFEKDPRKCFLGVYGMWKEDPHLFTWQRAIDILKRMDKNRLARTITGQLGASRFE